MKITRRQLRRIIKEELQFPDDVLVDSDSQDYQQGYADAYDGLKMQKNQSQQYQDGWDDGHFDIIRDNKPYAWQESYIREAVGDQLPYSMGGPWVDKDAPVGKGAKEYDDLDTELTDKEIEDAMGWEPATGNDALIDALIFGWAQWTDEHGHPDPGLFAPQEKGDAALSWVSKNEPDIARQINALSTHNLRALFDAAFDPDADRGHKTSAMDWLREALTQSQRATAAYAAEHRREHGQKGVWKTSSGDDEVDWKVGDLVRKVDYYGTGYGEDYKKSVGDQIGTVIEIDEDIDGTQYTVIFPDGTTVMDTWDSFEAPK